MTKENEIWEMAKGILQEKLKFSDVTFKLWFGEMYLKVLNENTAFFQIEDNFHQNIVNSKYLSEVKASMAEILGFEVEIVVLSIEKENFENALAKALSKEKDEDESHACGSRESLVTNYKRMDNSYLSREIKKSDEEEPENKRGTVLVSGKLPDYKPEYTFDNFVVGGSNKTAYTAARTVAQDPAGSGFNPLFLYGDPGLGKTHLLYAITSEILLAHPDYNIIYVKGEDFTNELIEALALKAPVSFREKYRKVDVLLVDDVQFIAGKNAVQEEFFHTFDALFEAGKQIVVSSDRPPKDMKQLETRLRSRFESGFITDISTPDLELRVAILKRKAAQLGIDMPNDVLMYLGENIKDNVRQIEGALKKMRALAYIQGEPIGINHAKIVVNDVLTNMANAITPAKILSYIAQKYNVPEEDIKSSKRTKDITSARHLTIYLIRTMLDMTFVSVGKIFNRDHSTVMATVEKVEAMRKTNPEFDNTVNELMREIKAGNQ